MKIVTVERRVEHVSPDVTLTHYKQIVVRPAADDNTDDAQK
jgi:hypothetical protein